MKSIVRSLVAASVCGLFALVNQTAHAQTKPAAPAAPGAPKKAHRPGRMEMMMKALNVTPAQEAKLKDVQKASGAKRKAINDALLTADGRKAQLKALDATTMTQMAAILTPAQQAKYMQLMAADRAARAKKAAASAAAPPKP